MNTFNIQGNVVDIVNRRIFPANVQIEDGIIKEITYKYNTEYENYILPGFIDAHVHIESSMLVPSEFARLAVVHGTVATVSDPHEIANVLGLPGINFMLDNGEKVPFKFYFGAPSCVPATPFETSGAVLTSEDIRKLLSDDKIKYLSEMMNFPGVLNDSPDVIEKLQIAKEYNKPVDGHAPGLTGDNSKKYIDAGITTDHECLNLEEAVFKIENGMNILIREGSAAKDFENLYSLIDKFPNMCMFCSDDKHPDDLVNNHINDLVKRAISKKIDLFNVLQTACINPIKHYNLDVGMFQKGDAADFIVVDNLKEFNVLQTYVNGNLVSENGKTLIESVLVDNVNKFLAQMKNPAEFSIKSTGQKLRVIEAFDGSLITKEFHADEKVENGNVVSDIENDILKIAVVNRYNNTAPALGFIKNFGLKKGAIASSVGHDSHNIIAVGTTDELLCKAVNAVIELKGGMVVVDYDSLDFLSLPVAGLMSDNDGYVAAKQYSNINKKAKALGSNLHAPFMTLSFMALLVIPNLKLSDKGLFDTNKFEFVDLQV
jgi:adenine deaminase